MFTKLLDKLARRLSRSGVFNPYKDERLLNNLKCYLEYLYENNHGEILLIGEAPGYCGCRLTGIPFSSGALIVDSELDIFKDIRSKILLEKIESEKTATMIWECMGDQKHLPILWNAFPFHPYQYRKPLSNRAPTNKEIKEGRFYIEELVRIFEPKIIASIGRKGQIALAQIYPHSSIKYIRHPSYGGKSDFLEGMDALLAQKASSS